MDATQLAIGSQSGEVVILNTVDFSVATRFAGHTEAITSVAWSPDELKTATSSRDNGYFCLCLVRNDFSHIIPIIVENHKRISPAFSEQCI